MSKWMLKFVSFSHGLSLQNQMIFTRAFGQNRVLFQTHYETLRIPPSSTTKEIKNAYIQLTKECHPDLHPNDQSMHDKFVRIQEAYQVLSNPSTKSNYDSTIARSRKPFNEHFRAGMGYTPPKAGFSSYEEFVRKHRGNYQWPDSAKRQSKFNEGFERAWKGKSFEEEWQFNQRQFYGKHNQNFTQEELNRMKSLRTFVNPPNFLFGVLIAFIFVLIGQGLFNSYMRRQRFGSYEHELHRMNEELRERREMTLRQMMQQDEFDRYKNNNDRTER